MLSSLASFDGRHTEPLERFAEGLKPRPAEVRQLIVLAQHDEPRIATAATWVLKRLQDRGHTFTPGQTAELLELLPTTPSWETALHVLQMLPAWRIAPAAARPLFAALDTLRGSPNKLLRAWAYNALVLLADQHATYRPQVNQRLTTGAADPSGAVKARIRNALKGLNWGATRSSARSTRARRSGHLR